MYELRSQQVRIANLKLFAYHGVLPQERVVGAYYIINIGVAADFSRALESDALEDTLSYAGVYEVVKAEMAVPSKLLEHVAGRICRAVLERFPTAEAVTLEILKENPPMGADVRGAGVYLEMSRAGETAVR